MKNTCLIVLFFIALSSCTKDGDQVPKDVPKQEGEFEWIPNWKNTTLVATPDFSESDQSNGHLKNQSQMQTKVSGDTSLVIYLGKKYYIWTECSMRYAPKGCDKNWFSDNNITYINCYITPTPFDTSGVIAGRYLHVGSSEVRVTPSRYYNKSESKWVDQMVRIELRNSLGDVFPDFYTIDFVEK